MAAKVPEMVKIEGYVPKSIHAKIAREAKQRKISMRAVIHEAMKDRYSKKKGGDV